MPISPSPAVTRACTVLHHLAQRPTHARSVSELARELGVPRATCDAILQGLADGGLVTRGADLRYELGPGCLTLGDAARLANPVLRATSAEAEQLARAQRACAAVSVRDGGGSRVAEVFDFGPPFGVRAQAGQSIPHTPPFGAVYVAWHDADADEWIARAGSELSPAELERYQRALGEVRRRGYSVMIAAPRRPTLADALDALVATPDADLARRARDEVMTELLHSEYLATDLDADTTLRVSHMSAPVFDHAGRAVASILLLGPEYDITTAELRLRGDELARAAARATAGAGGHPPARS
jgi:DNA-binding IclR family transcriptional regulator